LAATETVRDSELLHLTPGVYLAGDENVKRNYSSPWYQARGYVSQPVPAQHGQRIAVRCLSDANQRRIALAATRKPSLAYSSPETSIEQPWGRFVANSETGATARRLECTLSPGAPDC
jgi:hypothetical protein